MPQCGEEFHSLYSAKKKQSFPSPSVGSMRASVSAFQAMMLLWRQGQLKQVGRAWNTACLRPGCVVRCGDDYTFIVACHVYAAHGWPVKAFGDHADPLNLEFNVQEVQPWEWKVVLDPADWQAYPVKAAISAHADALDRHIVCLKPTSLPVPALLRAICSSKTPEWQLRRWCKAHGVPLQSTAKTSAQALAKSLLEDNPEIHAGTWMAVLEATYKPTKMSEEEAARMKAALDELDQENLKEFHKEAKEVRHSSVGDQEVKPEKGDHGEAGKEQDDDVPAPRLRSLRTCPPPIELLQYLPGGCEVPHISLSRAIRVPSYTAYYDHTVPAGSSKVYQQKSKTKTWDNTRVFEKEALEVCLAWVWGKHELLTGDKRPPNLKVDDAILEALPKCERLPAGPVAGPVAAAAKAEEPEAATAACAASTSESGSGDSTSSSESSD